MARRSPRERIVDAALRVFSGHGVEGTSLQDVADRARMSKQALLHHFPSKDHLRRGVWEHLAHRLSAQLPAAAGELVSRSHDRYRALLEVAQAGFAADPTLARFVVFELLERPDAFLTYLRTEAAPWLGLVKGVVDQQGSRPGFDPEAHVAALGLMMLGQAALLAGADPRWRTRVAKATLRIMTLGSHLKVASH